MSRQRGPRGAAGAASPREQDCGAANAGARRAFAPAEGVDAAIYSTDAFRISAFKVLMCSNRSQHEWRSCPFAHPGEHAKRRALDKYAYSSELCPYVRRGGACPHGDACLYSRHVFEMWCHPDRYKTQLCVDGEGCKRKICFFAHGLGDLRYVDHSTNELRVDLAACPPAHAPAPAPVGWPPAQQLPDASLQAQRRQRAASLGSCPSPLGSPAASAPLTPSMGGSNMSLASAATAGGGQGPLDASALLQAMICQAEAGAQAAAEAAAAALRADAAADAAVGRVMAFASQMALPHGGGGAAPPPALPASCGMEGGAAGAPRAVWMVPAGGPLQGAVHMPPAHAGWGHAGYAVPLQFQLAGGRGGGGGPMTTFYEAPAPGAAWPPGGARLW